MTCFYCKGELTESLTNHMIDLGNCILIVKNVPCMKCSQCGETVFTVQVAKQLDDIADSAKQLYTEIAVVNYADAVA